MFLKYMTKTQCLAFNLSVQDRINHTSYLSFLLHGQDFWVHFCSTQKYVNRDKMDFAPKQRKSCQDSIHCKFVTWSKVWYREQFVVDPHNKITPHDKQFCDVKFLFHMTINNFHVKRNCSTWTILLHGQCPRQIWCMIIQYKYFITERSVLWQVVNYTKNAASFILLLTAL